MKKAIFILTCTTLFTLFIYGRYIEPYQIKTHHIFAENLWEDYLPKGITLSFLSDVHLKKNDKIESIIFQKLKEIHPDLILLGGDYVPWGGDYGPAFYFLENLKAPYGVYGVMGDYDTSNSRKSCLFCHQEGMPDLKERDRLRILKNETVQINIRGHLINVVGSNANNNEGAFYNHPLADKNAFPIFLSHSPLNFDLIQFKGKSIVLSGDTHGGQVFLPKWMWRIMGYEKNFRYNHGIFREGKKRMIVTKGVGTSHVRFRLFCKPEIIVIHL